jgi:hypothetical protein
MNMTKHIDELKPSNKPKFNLRGTPIHICVSGSKVWDVKCMFEDNQISMYFLDMSCSSCGSLATAPTLEEPNCD